MNTYLPKPEVWDSKGTQKVYPAVFLTSFSGYFLRCQKRPFLITFPDKRDFLTRYILFENVVRNGLAITSNHGSTQHTAT